MCTVGNSCWKSNLIKSTRAIFDLSSAISSIITNSLQASTGISSNEKMLSHLRKFSTPPETSFLTSAESINFYMNCFILSIFATVLKLYGAKWVGLNWWNARVSCIFTFTTFFPTGILLFKSATVAYKVGISAPLKFLCYLPLTKAIKFGIPVTPKCYGAS